MIRLPNRASQAGVFKTGTTNYVDVSTGAAAAGMRTFGDASTDWDNGDMLGALVVKDDSNWQVWSAAWNGTSNRVELATLEDSAGTLTDDDAVTVTATVTTAVLDSWRGENQRERLTAARTYYVATTGSDSANGLTSGSPFATIQKAVDVVCSLDLSIYQATIQLADGTYTAGAILKSYHGALPPLLIGNATTPGNTVVHVTEGMASIQNTSGREWRVESMELKTTTSGSGLFLNTGSSVSFSNLRFGACASAHIHANAKSLVTAAGNYAIVGAAQFHAYLSIDSSFVAYNITVTITGTPAFSVAFVYATLVSSAYIVSCTFSGSATGSRYYVAVNSACFTSGAGETYLPGNAVGSAANGGEYA